MALGHLRRFFAGIALKGLVVLPGGGGGLGGGRGAVYTGEYDDAPYNKASCRIMWGVDVEEE